MSSHRDRIQEMKMKSAGFVDPRHFRALIRNLSARDGGIYYTVLNIRKRIHFKKDGIVYTIPKVLLDITIVESNLPMPANVYNPVFKYRRDNKENPLDATKVSYVGLPTPEEYFTLPEGVDNQINKSDPPGDYFLTPGFLKWFEDMESADGFLTTMADQIKIFLCELQEFVEANKKYFDWEEIGTIGIMKTGVKKGIVAKEYGVSMLIAPDIDNPEQKG